MSVPQPWRFTEGDQLAVRLSVEMPKCPPCKGNCDCDINQFL